MSSLGGLSALLTAKSWERAAIVYAFTEPDSGQRTDLAGFPARSTLSAFAGRGIVGLTDRDTVAWVRQAWEDAIADGQAVAVNPGDEATLPDRDFPKHPRTRSTFDGFRAQIRNRPDALRELVRDEPEIATMVAAQIMDTPSVRTAVEAKLAEPITAREVYYEPRSETKRDFNDDLIRATNLLMPALRARQRGDWQPSPVATMLLHSLGTLLGQDAPGPATGRSVQRYRAVPEGRCRVSVTLKKCHKGRTHDDGLQLVEYLMARGGKVEKTTEAIAFDLSMLKHLGGGNLRVDMSRFAQARNHVQDGTDAGKPCCGYRLHYRSLSKGAEFTLIDPTGDLGPHAGATIASVLGWVAREKQHHTENQRQIETWERLGEHALARGDKVGYRICQRASVELNRDGTVSAATMAEANVWLDALKASAA
jgi:hypothetical protein